MRNKILILFLFVLSVSAYGQEYSTFYYQRATLFEQLPIGSKDIVFLGNSITNGGEWAELLNNPRVKNRGISGDVCQGVYDRLDPIVKGKPKKVFLLIGTNDLSRGRNPEFIVKGIQSIVDKIHQESPRTKVYVQSILPVNNTTGMFSGHTSKSNEILEVNSNLKLLSKEWGVTYIDLHSHFIDDEGKMNLKYSNDGLHLLGAGYLLWSKLLKPYM